MDIKIPPDKAKVIVRDILKEKGPPASWAVGSVPGIIDEWTIKGVHLYIDSESELYKALIKHGFLTR